VNKTVGKRIEYKLLSTDLSSHNQPTWLPIRNLAKVWNRLLAASSYLPMSPQHRLFSRYYTIEESLTWTPKLSIQL